MLVAGTLTIHPITGNCALKAVIWPIPWDLKHVFFILCWAVKISVKRPIGILQLDLIANKFQQCILINTGRDSIAFYVSGQLLTEDYYVVNKFVKGYFGTANIDTNSRLCMSSAVAAHKRAFGEDIVPASYEDFEHTDMVVLVGSNTAWCHPVLYQRIMQAKEQRDLFVVVIDPRFTSTCEAADLHLPILPGQDVTLFNGLLQYLSQNGHAASDFIAAHTHGFEQALIHSQTESSIERCRGTYRYFTGKTASFLSEICPN